MSSETLNDAAATHAKRHWPPVSELDFRWFNAREGFIAGALDCAGERAYVAFTTSTSPYVKGYKTGWNWYKRVTKKTPRVPVDMKG